MPEQWELDQDLFLEASFQQNEKNSYVYSDNL